MPGYAPQNASPAFNQALSDLSRFLTPRRFRKHERKVAQDIDFKDVLRSIAQRQFEYLDSPRRNYVQARSAWFRDLAPCHAYGLGAANMEARIAFMEIGVRHLQRHREFYEEPIFFVTISPRRFACPIEVAAKADLHALKQTVRQALSGFSFVGMIDFGLLKSWGREGIPRWNNHVSPHAHCLVAGATRDEIERAVAEMGADFVDITGGRAADIERITARQLEGYFRYALKPPLFEYQVRTGKRWRYNAETEERVRVPRLDGRPLRSGNQLCMAAVVHNMFLDELLFGQGEGTALVREIRAEAREPIRRKNEVIARQGGKPCSFIPLARGLSAADRVSLSCLVRSPPRHPRVGAKSAWFATQFERSPRKQAHSFFDELQDLN